LNPELGEHIVQRFLIVLGVLVLRICSRTPPLCSQCVDLYLSSWEGQKQQKDGETEARGRCKKKGFKAREMDVHPAKKRVQNHSLARAPTQLTFTPYTYASHVCQFFPLVLPSCLLQRMTHQRHFSRSHSIQEHQDLGAGPVEEVGLVCEVRQVGAEVRDECDEGDAGIVVL